MPARVEHRLGSIFDEPCDLLVIPASVDGAVAPGVEQELRKAGIPLPPAMAWGSIKHVEFSSARFPRVAYAAIVGWLGSPRAMVERVGAQLGLFATSQLVQQTAERVGQITPVSLVAQAITEFVRGKPAPQVLKIATPLLGAGFGVTPDEAALALERGFMSTAPERAVLVISVAERGDYKLVSWALSKPLALRWPLAGLPSNSGAASPGTAADDEKPAASLPTPVQQPVAAQRIAETAAAERKPHTGSPPARRRRVFISYSHADKEWLERLQKHLKPLEREGVVVWDDTRLRPGEPWREEIRKALAETKVAILLISADFLASDFIVTDELPPLLKAAEEDGATILPVIISPSRFERMESLSRFQAVNDPQKPLMQIRRVNQERVFDQVAREVEDALKR